jgi:hypothetical protein
VHMIMNIIIFALALSQLVPNTEPGRCARKRARATHRGVRVTHALTTEVGGEVASQRAQEPPHKAVREMLARLNLRSRPHPQHRVKPPAYLPTGPSLPVSGTMFAVHCGSPLMGPTLPYDEKSKTIAPGPSLSRQ